VPSTAREIQAQGTVFGSDGGMAGDCGLWTSGRGGTLEDHGARHLRRNEGTPAYIGGDGTITATRKKAR
jgi:hypothetical protein